MLAASRVDDESTRWAAALGVDGPPRDVALLRLRALLTAVAWFELERRRPQLEHLSTADAARLVRAATDNACAALLERLGDYRGQSRFAVWAAKFAIRETAAAVRMSVARLTVSRPPLATRTPKGR